MKMIFEIPEDAYDYVMGSGYFPSNFNMISEIRNGTPIPDNATVCDIEQIRAEIEHEADYQDAYVDADVAKGLYMAVEIIDKYTKGAEE